MEVIYVVLLLAILIILVSHKNQYIKRIDVLERRIVELNNMVRQSLINRPAEPTKAPPAADAPKAIFEHKAPEPPKPQPVTPAPVQDVPPENIERQKEVITEPIIRPPEPREYRVPPPARVHPPTPREPQLSFFEKHPDLEKFIGENLINKIGIAILVLAIGFFVKYAIDNNWVGPVGRVSIGVVAGGILIGIAHRMRNSYRSFSSVLVGGGLAVLYFTITLAYHQFHLFNQTASFIILIVITCFAVALSLLYDKQELAVIALVGRLASPFMVSSGQANYNGLFIYLVILNAGLLVIAYFKSWRILNTVAFGLTVLVYLAVLTTLTALTYSTGLLYASILYLLFFGINVANNVKENKAFVAGDFSILLANTALYFSAGLYLLTQMHHEDMRGVFSASLALVNLLLSYILFRNKKVDTNILYLLIGITLTFVSLTAPLQLNGHYITLFWAAEAVLLYWLHRKSGIMLMKLASLTVWGAMIVSLLMDWGQLYSGHTLHLPVLANKGFITTLFAAVGSYLLYLQIKKDQNRQLYGFKIPIEMYGIAAFVLLFSSGFLEVNHQFLNRYPYTDLNVLYLLLYIPTFVLILHALSRRINSISVDWRASLIVLSLCVLFYIFALPVLFDVEYVSLAQHKISASHFAAHWPGALAVGLLFYQIILLVKNEFNEGAQKKSAWAIAILIVVFLSLEGGLASNLLFYNAATTIDHIQTVYIKVGLPILWGLSSFALMILGMRNKVRSLRIISLSLFTVTLAKLFVFDIQGIPPAGKIAAFFCLGVLLLIVSFMYQKVKKILTDDEADKTKE